MASNPNGLPRRPAANGPGPSQTRPVSYPTPIPSMSFTPSPSNLSGGYGGYQASTPVYNPAYAYPSYPQYPAYPYGAYGAYPAMPNPYQSFGQSLFYQSQQPQSIPHYPQMPAPVPVEPPNKRQKIEAGQSASGDPRSWRNCSQDGCKFVGPGDKVEQHEGDRHLIFRNGPKVELSDEEKMYAHHKGPAPPVFGTSITLHTEEEIAKWVADRKANWPGAQRLAQKKAEREQAIARGENPDSKKRRDRRTMDPAAMAEDWGRAESSTGNAERGGRGRGRDRGRGAERGRGRGDREGGGAGRGRGERGGLDGAGGAHAGERGGRGRGRGRGGAESDRTQDTGYPNSTATLTHTAAQPSPTRLPPKPKAAPNTAASGISGLGEYQSSSSSSDSSSSSNDSSDDSMSSISSDDDEPALPAKPAALPARVEQRIIEEEHRSQPMCPHWMKHGRCRQGDKCHLAHPADHKPVAVPTEPPRKQPRQPLQKKPNPFARPSLLGQLLANPIENTLSQLTQTIRFLVANDMLKGVESSPGQAEEEQRKRELVQVVKAEDDP